MRGGIVLISAHRYTVVVIEALVVQQPYATGAVRLASDATNSFRELAFPAFVPFVDEYRAEGKENEANASGSRACYYCGTLGCTGPRACCGQGGRKS